MNENRLLSVKEVGAYLGIGRDKTRYLFNLEDFPTIKLGQKYLVFENDLIEWLKDHRGSKVYF